MSGFDLIMCPVAMVTSKLFDKTVCVILPETIMSRYELTKKVIGWRNAVQI